jgi:hypothetical protein
VFVCASKRPQQAKCRRPAPSSANDAYKAGHLEVVRRGVPFSLVVHTAFCIRPLSDRKHSPMLAAGGQSPSWRPATSRESRRRPASGPRDDSGSTIMMRPLWGRAGRAALSPVVWRRPGSSSSAAAAQAGRSESGPARETARPYLAGTASESRCLSELIMMSAACRQLKRPHPIFVALVLGRRRRAAPGGRLAWPRRQSRRALVT